MQNPFLINGRIGGCLNPFDRGFAYGDGIFRTLTVRRGLPHCWERHYRKLSDDCNALGIICPPRETLLADIHRLCGENEDVAIKIIVTRGESDRGYAVPPLAQPTRVVLKSPLPCYSPQNDSEGVVLHLCELRLSLQPRLAGIKHLNRLENVLARMEWVDTQIADGLLLDASGYLIECTMSNLFIRTGNVLATPDLSRCGVAGVTRQRIIELAPQLGYSIRIADLNLEELLQADEVIICNSLYGAWQVRALRERMWAAGSLAGRLRDCLNQDETHSV